MEEMQEGSEKELKIINGVKNPKVNPSLNEEDHGFFKKKYPLLFKKVQKLEESVVIKEVTVLALLEALKTQGKALNSLVCNKRLLSFSTGGDDETCDSFTLNLENIATVAKAGIEEANKILDPKTLDFKVLDRMELLKVIQIQGDALEKYESCVDDDGEEYTAREALKKIENIYLGESEPILPEVPKNEASE